jgi:8-oxo-dGTP pyrophosphatase MutT (NUDIX family)
VSVTDEAGGDRRGLPGPTTPAPRDAARVAALRRNLVLHIPADGRERTARARFLGELDRLPRPLDEAADPVHVTASAVVAGRRGTLLHRHKRLGLWLQPGGHIDPGEDPADAARRETTEETGLPVTWPAGAPTLIHVDVHDTARGHTHLDLRYLAVGPDADPAPPPGESQEVRWFSWDEALTVADTSLAGALNAARRHLSSVGGCGGA